MSHTLEIITEYFCKRLRSLLPPRSKIFPLDGRAIKSLFYRAISILELYVKTMSRIVKTDFALRKHDCWKRGKFESGLVNLFMSRLQKIVWIQSIHDEISSALISEEEKYDFSCMRLLEVHTSIHSSSSFLHDNNVKSMHLPLLAFF